MPRVTNAILTPLEIDEGRTMTTTDWKNQLYFGDNIDILRSPAYLADSSVDLIYLDPPFNSKATYNVLFKERSGQRSAAQITAFKDTWRWDISSELAYRDVVTNAPGKLPDLLVAMRSFLETRMKSLDRGEGYS